MDPSGTISWRKYIAIKSVWTNVIIKKYLMWFCDSGTEHSVSNLKQLIGRSAEVSRGWSVGKSGQRATQATRRNVRQATRTEGWQYSKMYVCTRHTALRKDVQAAKSKQLQLSNKKHFPIQEKRTLQPVKTHEFEIECLNSLMESNYGTKIL
jgi:hypothetical protein